MENAYEPYIDYIKDGQPIKEHRVCVGLFKTIREANSALWHALDHLHMIEPNECTIQREPDGRLRLDALVGEVEYTGEVSEDDVLGIDPRTSLKVITGNMPTAVCGRIKVEPYMVQPWYLQHLRFKACNTSVYTVVVEHWKYVNWGDPEKAQMQSAKIKAVHSSAESAILTAMYLRKDLRSKKEILEESEVPRVQLKGGELLMFVITHGNEDTTNIKVARQELY